MPTLKPRLTVMLEQSDFDALTRLAKLQGRPTAAVARDFIAECSSIFNQISDALEAAQKIQNVAPRELLERLDKAQKNAAPILLDLLKTLSDVAHLGDV